MNEEILISDTIIFDAKPDAVPYKYRISYKMGQICMILAICNDGSSCSLLKIQMISNALNDKQAELKLFDFCNKSNFDNGSIIRFDPTVNRILHYAVADDMVKQLVKGTYKLTQKGKEFVKQIKSEKDLMIKEIEFLKEIKDRLPENKISKLMDMWRYTNVTNWET